jgi:hypothetical protein
LRDNAAQFSATIAKSRPALGMLPTIIGAVASGGRSLLRNPREFAHTLEKALKHSRSPSEALGKLGGEQAKKRLGHVDDPRYIDRYHGPDGMTHNPEGRLNELEYKGTKGDSTAVAKNKSGDRQGSKEKNKDRADLMVTKKASKVGQPSNRQGGAYMAEEIGLWSEIKRNRGDKDHLSVHTNTETGKALTLKRDQDGNNPIKLDEFKIEDFDAYKSAIEKHFMELKK